MAVLDRLKGAWNAFFTRNIVDEMGYALGPSSYQYNPSRQRAPFFNNRTIVSSVYTRIAIDVAKIKMKHVQLDEEGRYQRDIKSELNSVLTYQPNIDQAPQAWRQDIVQTLFNEGCAALVPVDTNINPKTNETFDILTVRVGRIVEWKPHHVKVSLYNEATGNREEILLEKRFVAVVENPLYSVMNEPNSTLQRLIRKLGLLDAVDEQSGSGKLDLIIQLPFTIKSEARRQQAEARRTDIEMQLKGSQYGIAYADATEKITQLNRPAENNLMHQVEYLTEQLFNELGITAAVMNGTADEKAMINYYARTIEPLLVAIVEAMQRSFLGRDKTDNGERIAYFRDAFQLVPVADLAEIADKFLRNEIFTANEFRQFLGYPPSKDPKADQLRNSNMPEPQGLPAGAPTEGTPTP